MGADTKSGHTTNLLNLRSIAESFAIYVAIPAVTLYPLGFVALWIQILRDPAFPSEDMYMAWYAVSLVPRTVAAGTGIHVVFLSLVAILPSMSIALLTFDLWQRYRGKRAEWGRYAFLPLVMTLLLGTLWALNPEGLWGRLDVTNAWDKRFLAGFVVLSVGVGLIAAHAMAKRYSRNLLPRLLVAYAGTFLAALCIAALEYPALPTVQVQLNATRDTPLTVHNDRELFVLLGYSGGNWDMYSSQTGVLSIPATEAKVVRILDPAINRSPE